MIPADPADTRFARCDLPAVALPDGDPGAGEARLLPRRYPQPSQARARFVGAGPPRIVTDRGPRGLWPLPQVRYRAGVTATPDPLDGGVPGTHWHRILMEACLPPGTNLSVAARAFDGAVPEGEFLPQPAPVWLPTGSEIPFEAGHFSPKEATEGLFEILLQRPDGPVRQLRGRHLELSLTLSSDGRRSPAIAAMRVYFPRNSWQEAYLPELFRQHAAPPEATGPASGADVRERLLAAFEGMLTPLEDRIAGAEGWLSPAAAPPAQLARLAAMLGTTLAPGPMERQRRHVALLGELQRTKGTMTGLALALDLATDGAVARSEVVPVEVYRLRRTMATLLGIDLDDRDHPLTLGTGQSGNSIIGDTLILAEDDARTFLALFAPGLAEATGDAEEVEAFFDAHAHRLAVVVHEAAQPLRAAIEDALAENVPAGVVWDIVETDAPFVLGLSPLLGIDTLIETNPAWRRVVLDDTRLGREGILAGLAAFAPERVEDDAARRTISGGAP
jgi:phage tail-like protein